MHDAYRKRAKRLLLPQGERDQRKYQHMRGVERIAGILYLLVFRARLAVIEPQDQERKHRKRLLGKVKRPAEQLDRERLSAYHKAVYVNHSHKLDQPTEADVAREIEQQHHPYAVAAVVDHRKSAHDKAYCQYAERGQYKYPRPFFLCLFQSIHTQKRKAEGEHNVLMHEIYWSAAVHEIERNLRYKRKDEHTQKIFLKIVRAAKAFGYLESKYREREPPDTRHPYVAFH